MLTSVFEVLRDPALKGESGRKVKKEKIRSISEEMFDFTELSKRSLGQNWNKLNPDQQKEFIKLFKSLLEETYADKITSYTDEKIIFKKGNLAFQKKRWRCRPRSSPRLQRSRLTTG